MAQNKSFPIEHLVVLMLENRSFDRMLGYLGRGEGLSGKEYNRLDPSDPSSEKVFVDKRGGYITQPDPAHDLVSVEKQLFGRVEVVNPAPMSGFVQVHVDTAQGDIEAGEKIMDCFDPAMIPALRTLAEEFCLCDHWFAAVPGPTWMNRFFAHCATSDGTVAAELTHAYEMRNIYDLLDESGVSWNVYYGDVPQCIVLRRLWEKLEHFRKFERFHTDLENGELARYTFIEPRYISFHEWKANDEHPPHDVSLGEYLIAEVYDTLRASPLWEKSLLVVLYDEHGGFYDHVSPPVGVPNPDGKVCANPPFDFTRLGVRVPAVLVSPFVERGKVDSTVYEHSSLPATIRVLFNLPESLTARDREANTFEKNLTRSTPRTDTPATLPVPGEPEEIQRSRELMRGGVPEGWTPSAADDAERSQEPLSLYQLELVGLGHLLNAVAGEKPSTAAALIRTEHEAAVHLRDSLSRFLGKAG